MKDKR